MRIPEGVSVTLTFLMVDETDFFTAETGLSPSVEISVDAGAFAATTNSASEISDGWYSIVLTAGEVTATIADGEEIELILRATGTGAAEYREKHTIYENATAKLASGSTVTVASASLDSIADTVLRRDFDSVQASSDGDTITLSSLYAAALVLVGKVTTSTDTVTLYHADGSTTIGTFTVTRTEGADPVTGRVQN